MISSKTTFKEGERVIHWADLKTGDEIEVTTNKEGSKIDAIEIIRVPGGSEKLSLHSTSKRKQPGE